MYSPFIPKKVLTEISSGRPTEATLGSRPAGLPDRLRRGLPSPVSMA